MKATGGLFIRSVVVGADRVMGMILWDCASSHWTLAIVDVC